MRIAPRISLNKLAEFMTAKPGRQQTIIKDQKQPNDFVVARYNLASNAITNYILQPHGFSLQNAIAAIAPLATDSKWNQQNAELCQAALIRFMTMAENLSWDGLIPVAGDNFAPKMTLNGVDISVRPEIILKSGNKTVGGIKLYINKGTPLNQDSGGYVSTVLYRYLSDVLSTENDVSRNACMVVDVFGQNIYYAPKAYKRTMTDVEAACRNIAILWDAL